jgi:recombination protein RecA
MVARALPSQLEALRARPLARSVRVVPTGLGELDSVLPDGGLPRGAVTELASTGALSLGTSIALRTVAAAQAEARLRGGESAFCAFLDPGGSLHGPGARAAGVDLGRLLVVRPPLDALARTAVRVVSSRVFSVVVIDVAGVPGAPGAVELGAWANAIRRLALAAEGGDTAIVLLTAREAARPLPLPVALRVELMQPSEGRLSVRIGKERRGLVGGWNSVATATPVRDVDHAHSRPRSA